MGLDRQEWVFSQAMRGWVRNLKVDLSVTWDQEGRAKVFDMIQQEVIAREGRKCRVLWDLLAMSPDCTTFSKADSSNISRGRNYRDHSDPERRPMPWTELKGKQATLAGQMVYLALCFLEY